MKGTGKNGRILKEDVLNFIDSRPPQVSDVVAETTAMRSGKVLTTPSVRRIASEEGVNLNEVLGTGENGRVVMEDIQRYLEAMKGEQCSPSPLVIS